MSGAPAALAASAALAAPAMPQVNLLPTEVRQARALGVVKRWLVASVGVTALAVGTVAAVAQLSQQDAASQLAQADAEAAGLLAEQRPYTEVTAVRAELESVRAARGYALGGEILWSDYLGAFEAVAPAGVKIHTLDYAGATPVTAAPTSGDPSVAPGVGTLTFTAQATSLTDTADWADALDAVPGFADVRMTTTTLADVATVRYEFTGTIQVEAAALAHRFDTETEGDS
jgi:Tfp pilus assembly protein PilN